MPIVVAEYVARWSSSLFADVAEPPWRVIQHAETHLLEAIGKLPAGYEIANDVAIHATASVEPGAIFAKDTRVGRLTLVDQHPLAHS